MKVLAFFALSAVATAAMAVQPPSTITLNGPSVQMTNSVGTAITNTSGARNEALQNIASNAGPVQVFAGGSSTQTANLGLGAVTNEAKGDDALARQNLASNNGEVSITCAWGDAWCGYEVIREFETQHEAEVLAWDIARNPIAEFDRIGYEHSGWFVQAD